jgi:transglutaminase-like putative cysteine protease
MEKYLKPTPAIDCDSRAIKEKAQNLTRGQEKITEKAKNLFYFVRDEISYTPYQSMDRLEYYRASKTLKRRTGWCVQKAVLLAALARAIEIPARLGFADLRNHIVSPKLVQALGGTNIMAHHGYAELYIQEKWVKATPAFDLKMCQENQIIPVEFNGKNDAVFHSHNQDGKLHIEYIKDYGHSEDVPLNEILDDWIEIYGAERVNWWNTTYRTRAEE